MRTFMPAMKSEEELRQFQLEGLKWTVKHAFEDSPFYRTRLKEGGEGELVLTTLTNRAYPLLRYRTSDVTSLRSEPCSCGRTLARMSRVLKRTDQLVCVRGINVFPEKVEEVLSGFEGVGPGYSLLTKGKRGMTDHLTIRVEAAPNILESREEVKISVKQKIQLAFRRAVGIGVEIEFIRKP